MGIRHCRKIELGCEGNISYSVTVHGVRPSIIPQIFGTPPSSIFRQCLIPILFSQKIKFKYSMSLFNTYVASSTCIMVYYILFVQEIKDIITISSKESPRFRDLL
jgi:hypothetical protein